MKKFLSFFVSLLAISPCFSVETSQVFFFSPEMISSYMKEYSSNEKEAILKDLEVVKGVCFLKENVLVNKPIYLATAGAPGSDHALIVEKFMAKNFSKTPFIYLDPDERGLKFMVHTYYSQSLSALSISQYKTHLDAVTQAYEKWRSASNFITYTLLEEAFNAHQNIAHGTTSTKRDLPSFFSKVKDSGYEIILLLCSANEAVLNKIIEHRNNEKKMYFSTPEDNTNKAIAFVKMIPNYLKYADALYIFWKNDSTEEEQLAAVLKKGKMEIVNSQALDRFIEQFEKDRMIINKENGQIPSWKELLSTYKSRF